MYGVLHAGTGPLTEGDFPLFRNLGGEPTFPQTQCCVYDSFTPAHKKSASETRKNGVIEQPKNEQSEDASKAIGEAVRRLLVQQDPKCQTNQWLKTALDLGHTAVWRKLNGEAKWTVEDLGAIAAKLEVGLADIMRMLAAQMDQVVTGVFHLEGKDQKVELVLEDGAPAGQGVVDYVAVEREGQWHVLRPSAVETHETWRYIRNVSMEMRPSSKAKVALLDDDPIITSQAASVLEKDGLISSERFSTGSDLIYRLRQDVKYDAFVVDWRLAEGTSEEVIRTIRNKDETKSTPIFVVTGAIEAEGDSAEEELARVVRTFGCKTMMKPVRWKLLEAEISRVIAHQ